MATVWRGGSSRGQRKTEALDALSADGSVEITMDGGDDIAFHCISSGSPGTLQILGSEDNSDFVEIKAATSGTFLYVPSVHKYYRFTVATYSSGSWTINIGWNSSS